MAALHRPALPAPFTPGKQRPGRLLLAGSAVMLVGTALFQVHQFSRLTSTGYEINGLQRQRAEREAENHELEAEVAQLSSLARVDWEARTRMGLVPAEQRLYIGVNHGVPGRQTLPTRFLPADRPDAPVPDSEPFWKRALKLLPFF